MLIVGDTSIDVFKDIDAVKGGMAFNGLYTCNKLKTHYETVFYNSLSDIQHYGFYQCSTKEYAGESFSQVASEDKLQRRVGFEDCVQRLCDILKRYIPYHTTIVVYDYVKTGTILSTALSRLHTWFEDKTLVVDGRESFIVKEYKMFADYVLGWNIRRCKEYNEVYSELRMYTTMKTVAERKEPFDIPGEGDVSTMYFASLLERGYKHETALKIATQGTRELVESMEEFQSILK